MSETEQQLRREAARQGIDLDQLAEEAGKAFGQLATGVTIPTQAECEAWADRELTEFPHELPVQFKREP